MVQYPDEMKIIRRTSVHT